MLNPASVMKTYKAITVETNTYMILDWRKGQLSAQSKGIFL